MRTPKKLIILALFAVIVLAAYHWRAAILFNYHMARYLYSDNGKQRIERHEAIVQLGGRGLPHLINLFESDRLDFDEYRRIMYLLAEMNRTAAKKTFLKGVDSGDIDRTCVSILGLSHIGAQDFCNKALETSHSNDRDIKETCLYFLKENCPSEMASKRIFELMDEFNMTVKPTRKWRDWD